MKALLHLVLILLFSAPALVWAEDAPHGGYRGAATLYYTLIWGILAYGLWDAFGKTALYVGAPVMAIVIYFLLPSA